MFTFHQFLLSLGIESNCLSFRKDRCVVFHTFIIKYKSTLDRCSQWHLKIWPVVNVTPHSPHSLSSLEVFEESRDQTRQTWGLWKQKTRRWRTVIGSERTGSDLDLTVGFQLNSCDLFTAPSNDCRTRNTHRSAYIRPKTACMLLNKEENRVQLLKSPKLCAY